MESFGRLIGINTQIVSPSGAFSGIGFAVPVDMINRVVPELIKHGKIIRPGLGLTPLPDEIAARLGIHGVVMGRTIPGGAAERAGLRGIRERRTGIELGDIIVGVGGNRIETLDELLSELEQHKIGDEIAVEVLSDGRRRQVAVVLQLVE